MIPIPANDLTRLQRGYHSTKLYLSILEPIILSASELDQSTNPSKGDTTITYINGVSSGWAYVEYGLTLYAGTSPGARDKGKIRLRSVTGDGVSGTLKVAENSIDWPTVTDITIIQFYEFWPIKPFIASDGTFYKDKDIAYTDQNSLRPPVVIAGSNKAGFMSGGSIVFPIDLSDSYVMTDGASIVSYSATELSSSGISIAINSGTGVGTITITTAGQYWVKFGAADSNGKSATTVRCYFAYDLTYLPYQNVSLSGPLVGDFSTGHWRCSLDISDNIPPSKIAYNGLVILWAREWFQEEELILGVTGNIKFVGYLFDEQWKRDGDTGQASVSFDAISINGIMRNSPMYPLSITENSNPSTWWQYKNLNLGRAVHHLLKEHSTGLDVGDIYGLNSFSTPIYSVEDFVQGNIYQQADSFSNNYGEHSRLLCRKDGILYLQKNTQFLDDTTRDTVPTAHTIITRNFGGRINIMRRNVPPTNFARLSGVAYNRNTGKATAYISEAPGNIPLDVGASSIRMERQVLASQSDANIRSGRLLATKNAVYTRLTSSMNGNWSGYMDIVPQDIWWEYTLTSDFFNRGIAYDFRLLLRHVEFSFNSEIGTFDVSVSFEPEAFGSDGVTVIVPPFPPTPLIGSPLEQEPELVQPAYIAATTTNTGVRVLPDTASTWLNADGGLLDEDLEAWGAVSDPYSFALNGDLSLLYLVRCSQNKIFYSGNRGVSWTEATLAITPGAGYTPNFVGIYADPYSEGRFYALAYALDSGYYEGWLGVSDNKGVNWAWITTGGGYDEYLPIHGAVGGESGSYFYITCWAADPGETHKLRLQLVDADTLSVADEIDLSYAPRDLFIDGDITAMVACSPDDLSLIGVGGQFYSQPALMKLGEYHKQVYDFSFDAQGWTGGIWEETKNDVIGMLTGTSANDCAGGSPDPVIFDVNESPSFTVNDGDMWRFIWRFETDGGITSGTIVEGFATLKLSGGNIIHSLFLEGETITGDTWWVTETIDVSAYAGQSYEGMSFQGCGTPAGTNKWYLAYVEYGNDQPAKVFKSEDQAVTFLELVGRDSWGNDRCGALLLAEDNKFMAVRVPEGQNTETVYPS